MKTTAKKQSQTVTIGHSQQIILIVLAVAAWLYGTLNTLAVYLQAGAYVGRTTWAYEITQWLLPIVLLGISLYAFRRGEQAPTARIFISVLSTVMVYTGYRLLLDGVQYLRIHTIHDFRYGGVADWGDFGDVWVAMTVTILLYVGILGRLKEKR